MTAYNWELEEKREEAMTIQYDSFAYGATVINGRVRYYKEYARNKRIIYTVYITEQQYNDYIKEIEQ